MGSADAAHLARLARVIGTYARGRRQPWRQGRQRRQRRETRARRCGGGRPVCWQRRLGRDGRSRPLVPLGGLRQDRLARTARVGGRGRGRGLLSALHVAVRQRPSGTRQPCDHATPFVQLQEPAALARPQLMPCRCRGAATVHTRPSPDTEPLHQPSGIAASASRARQSGRARGAATRSGAARRVRRPRAPSNARGPSRGLRQATAHLESSGAQHRCDRQSRSATTPLRCWSRPALRSGRCGAQLVSLNRPSLSHPAQAHLAIAAE